MTRNTNGVISLLLSVLLFCTVSDCWHGNRRFAVNSWRKIPRSGGFFWQSSSQAKQQQQQRQLQKSKNQTVTLNVTQILEEKNVEVPTNDSNEAESPETNSNQQEQQIEREQEIDVDVSSKVENDDIITSENKHATVLPLSNEFSNKDEDYTDSKDNNASVNDTGDDSKETTTPKSSEKDYDPDSGAHIAVKVGKKSNAVGDPDGEGSDDSDDDNSDLTEEWEEYMQENGMTMNGSHVEMRVELMDNEDSASTTATSTANSLSTQINDNNDDEEDDERRASKGGGVGVRFVSAAQRLSRRKNAETLSLESMQPVELEVWAPHVYLPPSVKAIEYLKQQARLWDSAGKVRLDRRTLYAGLLMEWMGLSVAGSFRKFLDPQTLQAMQAALSLATQPQWRKSFPRLSGIRLYEDDGDGSLRAGCTLAMQETIAMALAHSLGAGFVILDDNIISQMRQELISYGFSEENTKPAMLLESLLRMSRKGHLHQQPSGLLSKCMEKDIKEGLDDPFDERASSSCQEMEEWEKIWNENNASSNKAQLPLVIFLRADSCTTLLKSKSMVETLMRVCTSQDGINMLVIGKGIDAKTTSLPNVESQEGIDDDESTIQPGQSWLGFPSMNQNASGQNDPEGSRRFNIFLARTVDTNGTPGILGAIAPPQAGNLFPHMMATQARERMEKNGNLDDLPIKADLERWAQAMQQQIQANGNLPLPPPQFFNTSIMSAFDSNPDTSILPDTPPPPTEIIQQTLQLAMTELLDRLAQMTEDDNGGSPGLAGDIPKVFAQILRNEHLRKGISENLARAAPALSDPKCQGVMLSVYVPPPNDHINKGKLPNQFSSRSQAQMNNWFQNILNNQGDAEDEEESPESRTSMKQKRARTMAAAAAMMAARNSQDKQSSNKFANKAGRNLARLENLCRPIMIRTPSDPVRAKSWTAWIGRERGSVIFRQNRKELNEQLDVHELTLQEHTGTYGAGSSLRQMLSVRDLGDEMERVIKCSIELEAAKAQIQHESPTVMHSHESDLNVDISLSQLFSDGNTSEENGQSIVVDSTIVKEKKEASGKQYIHPSTLEKALSMVCRISPSPAGGLSISGDTTGTHRTKDEILALAQDKHERALVSQVVTPQDIGVTYDMIGGLSEVKELLRQSITYPLKYPHLYSEGIAREAVKGVLLFGPPGTGKTMLAKAVATEGGASFLSVDASSVENKWLGESEKNAKAVFTLARRLAPCVVFIDEVDSLLSSRETSSDDSAHGTLTSVKTTMMSEWDGLNSGTNGAGEAGSDRVIVIGSTNRPFDLDEAVLRRFPRRILVDLPDLETRREILEVTLAENRLDPSVNLTMVAERLEGYTGSDIKEVCREAVVQISHEQAKLLDQGFMNSREDVTQGSLQRLRPVTVEDFESALSKLKRSVSEKGRELARIWEWNDEYGEIKKGKKHIPHLTNMYL